MITSDVLSYNKNSDTTFVQYIQ